MKEAESSQQRMDGAGDPSFPATDRRASLREMATDAVRYWEPRRLFYNAVLAVIVTGYFFAYWPASQKAFTFDAVLVLFVLAVLANGCYCAAYIADLFAQFTGFRPVWVRWRGLLLAIGIVFAAIITRFFAMGFFAASAAVGN
jgi:hypothetical protein